MNSLSRHLYPVLLVDDEPSALMSYEKTLRYVGITNIISCHDARQVLELMDKNKIELVILDLLMPFMTGEELLKTLTKDFPHLKVIVVTGVDEVDTAVKCMKMGAFDYLVKPVDSDRLITTVKRALDFRELEKENTSLKQRLLSTCLEKPNAFEEIITGHSTMYSLFKYMEAVAPSPKPVLITGETGVGKELAAKALHELSGRPGPFVAANVAGLDDDMFSDTLFGHAKGAFTSANHPRKGLLAKAQNGTILLDEIGDLSPQSQVKLLRLLEQGEYYSLGNDTICHSKARIIASTNKDLKKLQQKGVFRKDLYYRLLTHHLVIPPLRQRKEDISILLDYFLENAAKALGKKKPTVPNEILDLLYTYSFPGNIRELEAMVFDAVSKHTGHIMSLKSFKARIFESQDNNQTTEKTDTPKNEIIFPDNLPNLKETSYFLVKEALKRANGNISIAANLLGISHQALRKRIKKSQIV